MKSVAVSCTDVQKRYGKRVALDGLTIDVPQGRMVGVLRPNGAGKSTWFRTLTGLTKPDAGNVRVLDAVPGWRTNAAVLYLPDRARWYPGHTVGDALNWGAALRPHFARERSLQMAEMMDLDPNQPVDGLSRGLEARLMLILCLARRVPLLILDEPLSGIDMISREQIIEALWPPSATKRRRCCSVPTRFLMRSPSLITSYFYRAGGSCCRVMPTACGVNTDLCETLCETLCATYIRRAVTDERLPSNRISAEARFVRSRRTDV